MTDSIVIIPTYNEKENIENIIRQAGNKHLEKYYPGRLRLREGVPYIDNR